MLQKTAAGFHHCPKYGSIPLYFNILFNEVHPTHQQSIGTVPVEGWSSSLAEDRRRAELPNKQGPSIIQARVRQL